MSPHCACATRTKPAEPCRDSSLLEARSACLGYGYLTYDACDDCANMSPGGDTLDSCREEYHVQLDPADRTRLMIYCVGFSPRS